MASNYKETHEVSVKGFLNYEDGIIEIEDSESVSLGEILSKFNGVEVSLSVQKVDELDK